MNVTLINAALERVRTDKVPEWMRDAMTTTPPSFLLSAHLAHGNNEQEEEEEEVIEERTYSALGDALRNYLLQNNVCVGDCDLLRQPWCILMVQCLMYYSRLLGLGTSACSETREKEKIESIHECNLFLCLLMYEVCVDTLEELKHKNVLHSLDACFAVFAMSGHALTKKTNY